MEEQHQHETDGQGLARCHCAPPGAEGSHSDDEGESGVPVMEITATEQANKYLLQSFSKSEVLQKFTGVGDDDAAGDDDEWNTPQDDDNEEPAEGAEVIRGEVESLSIQDNVEPQQSS